VTEFLASGVRRDYGGYDTSTRAKDVTAVVNVTFEIE